MKIPCEACRARGCVTIANRDWPEACATCGGRTFTKAPSLYAIANLLSENPTTIYRLRDMRTNGETSLRLLGELHKLAERQGVSL